jgi:hypothetical protein
MLAASRTARIVGIASATALVILISLEFWAPFHHVWDVQMVGFVLNSGASFYAARCGSRRWFILLGLNLLMIVVWIAGVIFSP